MEQDQGVSYEDLVQLALFPDGSSLSTRLQRASLLQQLLEKDAATHEKAVRFASLVNQEAVRALDQRRHSWKTAGSWPLQRSDFGSQQAFEIWAQEVDEQLKRLLKGVNLLAGFKAHVVVAATGIKLLDPKLHAKDKYTVMLWIEDLVGMQQDLPLGASISDDGGDGQLLTVNSEESFLRIQVWKKGLSAVGRPSPGIVGEVRVAIHTLPRNGDEVELQLPIFLRSSASAQSQVPVYDIQSPNVPVDGFSTPVQLQISISLNTEKPSTNEFDTVQKQAATPNKATQMKRTRTLNHLRHAKSGLNFQAGHEMDQQQRKELVRKRWAHAIQKIIRKQRLLWRSQANMELSETLNRSRVLQQPERVQDMFHQLTDQIWHLWARQTESHLNGPGHLTSHLAQCHSLDNNKREVGALVQDDQPLYFILKLYDEVLYSAVQNSMIVGKFAPGMTFFHPLFMFASMCGVRSLLFKGEMVLKLLGRWNRANEPLLIFVHETMMELAAAAAQDRLSTYERKLFQSLRQHLQPKMKKTLVQHHDMLDPSDAAGRRVLLQVVSQFMPSFNKSASLARELLKISQDRNRSSMTKCDVHKVDHVLKTLNVVGGEELQKLALALGAAWEQTARDFEADLGLEAESKDLVQVRDAVMEHYTEMREASQLLIAGSPSWPYTLYGAEAMSKIESSIMQVNKVLEKYEVAAPQKEKPKLKLHMSGVEAASLQSKSGLTGSLEKFWYKVVVYTSNLKGAGTDSEVYINIIGNASSSGKLVLNDDKVPSQLKGRDLFEKGEKNEFRVSSTSHLGLLQEVELGIDGQGQGHSWHCDRLEITEESSKQVWYFECNSWLSRSKGDMKLERKLTGSTEPPTNRKVRYIIKVQTSDIKGAGTDAYVHLHLQGSISEYKTLLDTKFKDNFERGREDQFSIYCSELGNINKIVVSLSSKLGHSASDDWHLQDIRVTSERTGVEWLFPCSSWFNEKQLSRELTPVDEGDLVEYRVSVYTADTSGASTDARVYIIMDGEESSSGLLRLKDKSKDTFERGQKDEFSLRCQDLGKLKVIKLGHDGSSGKKLQLGANAWHVLKVEVLDVRRSHVYIFPCNFWLGKSFNSKLEQAVPAPPPQAVQVRRKVVYIVTIYTSDITHASSNAKRVFVELIGANSSSGKQLLDTPKGGFLRGQSDSTRLECTDVGNLERIVIGHHGSSFGDSWHVDRIEVLVNPDQPPIIFPCNNWLSNSRGDKKTERTLFPSKNPGPRVKASDHASFVHVVGPPVPTFTVLDWPNLLWPKVEDQLNAIVRQYPPIIDRQLKSINTWTPVSQRLPYAAEIKPVSEATMDLMNACLNQVITVIVHSTLRTEVATRVLQDAVQPIVVKVSEFIKEECLTRLTAVQPQASHRPVTIFDDEGHGEGIMPLILVRTNTMSVYFRAVQETVDRFVEETTMRNVSPVDTIKVRREGQRMIKRVQRHSFEVVSALHKAMRFGFLVILRAALKEVAEEDLGDVLPGYLFDKVDELRKSVPQSRWSNMLNSSWTSLLEAAKRMALGLAVWDLREPYKLSDDKHRMLESCLKALELKLMTELGELWKPKESLLLVDEQSHVRLLLEAGSGSSKELQQQLLNMWLQQERELSTPEAEPNLPYQGTEVVVDLGDLMQLQQNQTHLDVLDYIRLLRCREDAKQAAKEKLQDLHKRRRMQVLFGLPLVTEREQFSSPCQLSCTPKMAAPGTKLPVPGFLFVFTTYLCFTTLLDNGSSIPALKTSDITCIIHREEDIKSVEAYSREVLWLTLSDESVLELGFSSESLRQQCYKVLNST